MSKLDNEDKKILGETTKVEKQFLLGLLRNIDVTEITKYQYEKNIGLRDEDNWEKIVIIRKPKRFNLSIGVRE